MKLTGEFTNPISGEYYKEAFAEVGEKFDCNTDWQGIVYIYSDASKINRVFTLPVVITKPANELVVDVLLLEAAIYNVCSQMVVRE